MSRLLRSILVGGFAMAGAAAAIAAEPTDGGSPKQPPDSLAAVVLHGLRNLATTARVLHIGAHPDDENTALIAYLSRGRGYDVAYLSITRGDGGQNLLGPELGDKLGVARTQELLAARRIDGGRQFFTRAIDFGFSKTPEEALSIWDHQAVLSDVVRIIRRFRPDIVVTRFPVPPGSGGHGHHTASAILALEAFKLAGDPKAFPEQLKEGLSVWQPKRIVWNGGGFMRGGGVENNPAVKVDIGGRDPVTDEPFGVIAARSRAMHKTQAMGEARSQDTGAARPESFVLLAGEPMTSDFIDGVDPTWARVEGATSIASKVNEVLGSFDPKNPGGSIPALLDLKRLLSALPDSAIVSDKRALLDSILERCLGLEISSLASTATVVPGDVVPGVVHLRLAASPVPVRLDAIEIAGKREAANVALEPGKPFTEKIQYPVAKDAAVTQPYWLRMPAGVGIYQVSDPKLIGEPANPPALPIKYHLRIGDQSLVVLDPLRYEAPEATAVKSAQPDVAIVSPASLRFDAGPIVVRPGGRAKVRVTVIAGRPNIEGTIQLDVPSEWKSSPSQTVKIAQAQDRATFTFDVVAPAGTSSVAFGARARIGAIDCVTDADEVQYAHIPVQVLQPLAQKRVVSVDAQTHGTAIGYIPGAGDDLPAALTQLGYTVTELKEPDITLEHLNAYDAIVIGVRAFNTRADLPPKLPELFAYVEQGGTVVYQYNWSRGLKTEQLTPYKLRVSDLRITDEKAAVTFLAPEHPVLTTPNKITLADFDGWVQERGTYYPSQWDDHFVPLLSMADPGEEPLKGGLLVAQYGKGYFVYSGLAFFRQLPAGVPGAYRLFANIVSLGK